MLWAFFMLLLMGWHGFTFEIGKKGKGFHLWHETYSLKRFFIKKKNSLKDIAGKWPGDETDEEFEEIIKSLKNRQDKVDNPLLKKGKIAR